MHKKEEEEKRRHFANNDHDAKTAFEMRLEFSLKKKVDKV